MREVKPTQKPVPSSDIKDLFFNSGLLDIWATSLEHKYIDRFGNCHLTAAGMEWIFNELVTKFNISAEQAIAAAGYVTIDSFQDGADITVKNQVLRWKLPDGDGEYYRWDGELPKSVPAGSTPQLTGGIGKGAWLSVGDASLRTELGQVSKVVNAFSDAKQNNNINNVLKTLGHTVVGVGSAEYFRTGNVGAPRTGNEGIFYDANGDEWKLKHDGEVFYTQFGIGLGANDDLQKLKEIHDFANAEGAIVSSGKKLTINASSNISIDVKTSTDFGGSKFVINDGASGSRIFSIEPSADAEPFDVPQSIISELQPELVEGAWIFPALQKDKRLENCLIVVENSERLSRRGAGTADVLRQDSFIHFRNGNCLGALLMDHTVGTLKVTARPLERSRTIFGNVNVVQNFTDKKKTFTFSRTQRNMTTYKDIFVENSGVISDEGSSSSVIQARYSAFLEVGNVDGENMNAGTRGNSGYVLSIQHCVGYTFDRVSPNSGWGVTNSNWVKNGIVTRSYLNRIDNHHGLGDLTIRDCRLIGKNIEFGYGRGVINIEDVVVAQETNPNNIPDDVPMALAIANLRAGWQLGYRGEINIRNATIEVKGDYPTTAARNWIGGVSFGRQNIPGCDPTVDFYMPNVNIDGLHLKIVGELTGKLEFFGVLMWDTYFDENDTNRVYAPSRILVDNMTSNNESELLTKKPFKGISTDMSSVRWREKECNIEIRSCHNSTSGFDINIANLAAYDAWRMSKSLFDWTTANINQDNSRVKFNIELNNCTGSAYLNSINGSIKANGGEIVELRAYGASASKEVSKVSHGKLWPLFRESGNASEWNWYFANQQQSLLAENCEIVPANYVNGTVTTVSLRDRQRLINCYTSTSAPINQDGVNRLWRSFEVLNTMYKKAQ